MSEPDNLAELVAVHDTELAEMERRMRAIENSTESLACDIREIRKELPRRPSWIIVLAISTMCSTITALVLKMVA